MVVLIVIAALVLLFPIGWFISKRLYWNVIATLVFGLQILVVAAVLWWFITDETLF